MAENGSNSTSQSALMARMGTRKRRASEQKQQPQQPYDAEAGGPDEKMSLVKRSDLALSPPFRPIPPHLVPHAARGTEIDGRLDQLPPADPPSSYVFHQTHNYTFQQTNNKTTNAYNHRVAATTGAQSTKTPSGLNDETPCQRSSGLHGSLISDVQQTKSSPWKPLQDFCQKVIRVSVFIVSSTPAQWVLAVIAVCLLLTWLLQLFWPLVCSTSLFIPCGWFSTRQSHLFGDARSPHSGQKLDSAFHTDVAGKCDNKYDGAQTDNEFVFPVMRSVLYDVAASLGYQLAELGDSAAVGRADDGTDSDWDVSPVTNRLSSIQEFSPEHLVTMEVTSQSLWEVNHGLQATDDNVRPRMNRVMLRLRAISQRIQCSESSLQQKMFPGGQPRVLPPPSIWSSPLACVAKLKAFWNQLPDPVVHLRVEILEIREIMLEVSDAVSSIAGDFSGLQKHAGTDSPNDAPSKFWDIQNGLGKFSGWVQNARDNFEGGSDTNAWLEDEVTASRLRQDKFRRVQTQTQTHMEKAKMAAKRLSRTLKSLDDMYAELSDCNEMEAKRFQDSRDQLRMFVEDASFVVFNLYYRVQPKGS